MKLIDVLKIYDFRSYQSRFDCETDKMNSTTVRINLGYQMWFEFGINDWIDKESRMEMLTKILSKDILNRKVEKIKVEDLEILEIHLEEQ